MIKILVCLFLLVSSFSANAVAWTTLKNPRPGLGTYHINNASYLIIDGGNFSSQAGHCIHIWNSHHIVIKRAKIDFCGHTGVAINESHDITIQDSDFNGSMNAGISADGTDGAGVYGVTIKGNNFKKIWNGAPHEDSARGQAVLFVKVLGTKQNVIEGNVAILSAGTSNPEDFVSIQDSTNVRIRGNCFEGNTSISGTTGSGIMTGDAGGGSNIIVEYNKLLTTGNVGVGVAGGTGVTVRNNTIYSPETPSSNRPLYVWNQQGAVPCSGHVIAGNRMNWISKDTHAVIGIWDAGNCTGLTFTGNNESASGLSTLHCSFIPRTF